MAGFQSPNYTQTPNDLFDNFISEMGEAELKVILAIIRGTFGYHRNEFVLSIRKIAKMTGLSINGVRAGAKAAEERGLIERVINKKRSTIWKVVVSPSDTTTNQSVEAELRARLVEIELKLKTLQQEFLDIKKRARETVSAARKRSDARELIELNKMLGIEQ